MLSSEERTSSTASELSLLSSIHFRLDVGNGILYVLRGY